jgi:hypothetical protein
MRCVPRRHGPAPPLLTGVFMNEMSGRRTSSTDGSEFECRHLLTSAVLQNWERTRLRSLDPGDSIQDNVVDGLANHHEMVRRVHCWTRARSIEWMRPFRGPRLRPNRHGSASCPALRSAELNGAVVMSLPRKPGITITGDFCTRVGEGASRRLPRNSPCSIEAVPKYGFIELEFIAAHPCRWTSGLCSRSFAADRLLVARCEFHLQLATVARRGF